MIIAVDVTTPLKTDNRESRSLIDVLDQTIGLHIEEMMVKRRAAADILLTPDLKDFSSADFDLMPEMVERGYLVADSRIAEICALLEQEGIKCVRRQRRDRLHPDFNGSTIPNDIEFEVGEIVLKEPMVMRRSGSGRSLGWARRALRRSMLRPPGCMLCLASTM